MTNGIEQVVSDLNEEQEKEGRSEDFTILLKILREEDPLFHYHVPSKIRNDASDEKLFDHLEDVYTAPEFVIKDPEVIKRYIEAGDRVRKKGEYKEVVWSLQPGDKGRIMEAAIECSVHIIGRTIKIKNEELIAYGKWGFFLDDTFHEPINGKDLQLLVNYLVEYTGDPQEECKYRIPNGTEGIVWKDDGIRGTSDPL